MSPLQSISPVLLDFDEPPVIETLLDVAFTPLADWRIPHFGLFWEAIKKDYPNVEDQSPILLQREQFGEKVNRQSHLSIQMLLQPEARCWFVSASHSRLIQVQNDRFIHNWRKVPGAEEPYPHYDSLRPRFAEEWARFCSFLSKESLGIPSIQQCEIQYINHIDFNDWSSYVNLFEPCAEWPGTSEKSTLPTPETAAIDTSYLLPNNYGRLRVSIQPAIRNYDAKPIIQLTLIARGTPAYSTTDGMLDWFDYAREWLLHAFAGFTTEKMHKAWKRR